MNEIFGKTATSEAGSAVYDAALIFVTNLRCLSRGKRCRVQFYRGSLQSALRSVPGYTRNGVKQALPDPGAEDGRWLCSSDLGGLRSLEGFHVSSM